MKNLPSIVLGSILMFVSNANGSPESKEQNPEAIVRGDLERIATSLETYESMAGTYPSTEQGLAALVTMPKSPKPRIWGRLLNEVPRDPWGREYKYALKGNAMLLWSQGQNPDADSDVIYCQAKRPKKLESEGAGKMAIRPAAEPPVGDQSAISEPEELVVKKVTKEVESIENVKEWSLDKLPHKEWLEAVSVKDWTLLHDSETEDFQFAIFRNGNNLIFWIGDRKAAGKGSSLMIGDATKLKNPLVTRGPFMEIVNEFKAPDGSSSHFAFADCYGISETFDGQLRVTYSVDGDGVTHAKVLDQIVKWTKGAEPRADGKRPEASQSPHASTVPAP